MDRKELADRIAEALTEFDDDMTQEDRIMLPISPHGWQMILTALRQQPGEPIPDVLFDGYAVLQALTDKERTYTSAENVSAVLDAVVRLLKSAPKPISATMFAHLRRGRL